MKIRFFLSAQVFLFLALAFLLAFVAPLAVDDWSFYHFVEGGSDSKILNLVASLREFYFTWGGRVLAQLMAIVILRTGPDLLFPFVVVGSFALFLVWFLRIAGHPLASVKSSLAPLLILGVGVFGIGIFLKVPLQTIYWITGAGSYLLTSVLMVAFVLKEHNFLFVGTESKRGVLSLAASCLLAFLAGAAFEVVGPSLLGLILYRWGLRWHRSGGEAHRPRWPHFSEVIVFLALLAGTAFLVFAPGNYVRLQATQPMGAPGLLERIDWFVQSLLVFFGRPDGVVYLAGVFVLFRFCRAVDFWRRLVSDPVASSLAVWFILSLITYFGHDGNFYGRKSYHNSLIFVALIVRVASLHLPVEKENLKNVARVVVGLVALAILRLGFDTYKVWSFALQMERREKEILASTEELITTYQIESAFDLDDLSADPKNWVNESYARFLGVRAIRALPREEIK